MASWATALTFNDTNLPEQIVASNVTAIAAGYFHSLFIKSDGSLWAMGDNNYGQLGDGTNRNTNQPEQIVANGVTAIAAGGYHSLFLKRAGNLVFRTTSGHGRQHLRHVGRRHLQQLYQPAGAD